MFSQRLFSFCLLVVVSCTLIGCGGGDPRIVPVTGVVTYKGQPIVKINVMFSPTDATGQIAEGTSDDTGKFVMQTQQPNDGAMMGDYKVSFKYVQDIDYDMPGFTGGVKPEPSPIPAKYADENKSGFTATVKSSNEPFQFDLE